MRVRHKGGSTAAANCGYVCCVAKQMLIWVIIWGLKCKSVQLFSH